MCQQATGATSLPTVAMLSLWLETVGVPAVVAPTTVDSHCCHGVVAVIRDGGCVAVLSLWSEIVGVPAVVAPATDISLLTVTVLLLSLEMVMTPATGATSMPTVAVLSLWSEMVGVPAVVALIIIMLLSSETVGVPEVIEAATGATSLPTDAMLSQTVSVPSVTVGCRNDVVAVVRGGRCRPTGSDGSSGCGTTIIG